MLTFAGDTWFRAFNEIGEKDYPDIKRDYNHVDACCMWFVKNPEFYDVIVTDNIFGDIITDLARDDPGRPGRRRRRQHQPQGRQHVRADGRQRPQVHRPERHQPDGRHRRRPVLVAELGEEQAADRIEQAIIKALGSGKIKSLNAGRMGMGTSEMGDLVASLV